MVALPLELRNCNVKILHHKRRRKERETNMRNCIHKYFQKKILAYVILKIHNRILNLRRNLEEFLKVIQLCLYTFTFVILYHLIFYLLRIREDCLPWIFSVGVFDHN